MNLLRVFAIIVAGCCMAGLPRLWADNAVPLFAFDKQYSTDKVTTSKEGLSISSKTYVDNGKRRDEMSLGDRLLISIIRPDRKLIYGVVIDRKMVMVGSYDPDKPNPQAIEVKPEGNFEGMGSETVEGVACTKYKVTATTGTVTFYWIGPGNVPVKMQAQDGSITVWKNYQAGPQDPALFEPPTGYQTINMQEPVSKPSGGGTD